MRFEGPSFDPIMVAKDAKDLFKAGEKKLGTDEKVFIRIFSERSSAQLAAIAFAYHDTYGSSLEKVVSFFFSLSFVH